MNKRISMDTILLKIKYLKNLRELAEEKQNYIALQKKHMKLQDNMIALLTYLRDNKISLPEELLKVMSNENVSLTYKQRSV